MSQAQSAFRLVLACWLVPLVLGLAVFAAWYVTRAEPLEALGIGTILLGAGLATVGGLLLVSFYKLALEEGRPRSWAVQRVLLAIFLLGSNFLVALGLFFAAVDLETRFEVSLQNDTAAPLSSLRLVGGGLDLLVDEVAPGSEVTQRLRFVTDGALQLEIGGPRGAARIVALEGYVTPNLVGARRVRFAPNGEVTVE